jgi:3-hydroxyisobutyrate dehydrogenase-like beta-hydroxyacid dehydrogenase
MNIGFIGLGAMGQVISHRLIAEGYQLTVWNRSRDKAEALIREGARWADSPADVARATDIVFSMVTDGAASRSVICERGGLLEGAHQRLTIIDAASIDPEISIEIAEQARSKGVAMLDAPVSGGPKVAAEGRLGIMVGGPKEAFQTCEPILKKLGSMVLYVGDSGKGTTLKLIANLVMGVAIQAVAESLVLATKAGIDPQLVVDITSLPGTGPQTGAMATRGPRMINHHFVPAHFSANNMYKDLTGALKLGEKYGVSLPAVSVAREMLRAVKAQDNGDIDSSAVVTVLETMANIPVRASSKAS